MEKMAELILRELTAHYQDKKQRISLHRSKMTEITQEEVFKLIGQEYKFGVVAKNKDFICNDDLIIKIQNIAKFLTSEKRKDALLLFGFVGVGKTMLADAICEVIDKYNKINSKGIFKVVKRINALEVGRLAINDFKEFEKLKNEQYLFVDDLGVEPTTIKTYGNEISPITELIVDREEKNMFSIFTSNLNLKEMQDRYGIRFVDRINQYCDLIGFKENKSFRK